MLASAHSSTAHAGGTPAGAVQSLSRGLRALPHPAVSGTSRR